MDYLKKNDEWDKSKLKSDEFKELIDYIVNEQIEEAFNHPYSKKDKINGYWKQCCNIYKEIKDTVDITKLEGAFRRAGSIINVHQHATELSL